jgi:elongation factor P
MISVTELRAGAVFEDAQGLWEVIEYKHVKMGRGSATIRVKVRNLKSGSTIEKTFTSASESAT